MSANIINLNVIINVANQGTSFDNLNAGDRVEVSTNEGLYYGIIERIGNCSMSLRMPSRRRKNFYLDEIDSIFSL